MARTLGGDEPGYLGFAMVDGLTDLLVTKGILMQADVSGLLRTLVQKLSHDGTLLGQRCAEYLTDRMAGKP